MSQQITPDNTPGFFTDLTAADLLIRAHDGDVALLYLYNRANPDGDEELAACALCRTLSDIRAAAEKLQRMGLAVFTGEASIVPHTASSLKPLTIPSPVRPVVPQTGARKTPPAEIEVADRLPEYQAEYIAHRSDEDPGFRCILEEGKKTFGRMLSTAEMQMLLGIYEYLGLPAEVILMLLNHCADNAKYRGQKRLSARSVEQEAYRWARQHIDTLESAEEYITRAEARQSDAARTAEILGIAGRPLSSAEKKYIDAWLDAGFKTDALTIAYNRTMLNAGNFSWPYMNSILENWKSRSLFTAAEIEEKDSRGSSQKNLQRSGAANAPKVDVSKLNDLIDLV